jgi:hypothetical protein
LRTFKPLSNNRSRCGAPAPDDHSGNVPLPTSCAVIRFRRLEPPVLLVETEPELGLVSRNLIRTGSISRSRTGTGSGYWKLNWNRV